MYTCKINEDICDPCCDFCWYCICDRLGRPVQCKKGYACFEDGLGYCDDFRCSIHEPKPVDP